MKINYAMIGYRIRSNRSRIGLSQQDLAERADLSVTYLSSIENARKKPSLNSLLCLSDALDMSLDELISGVMETDASPTDLMSLLSDCTETERRYFTDMIQNSKPLLRKYFV